MRTKLSLLLAAALVIALFNSAVFGAASASAQQADCQFSENGAVVGITETSLVSNNMDRSFIVYVPSGYSPTEAVPLVFSLHGWGSNARQQMAYSQWNAVAEAENFIVVYPNGAGNPNQWSAYDARFAWRNSTDADDVQFFRDLIAYMSSSYCIDPARIYVNGISNGGAMTVRLACELNDQIAAVATVAAAVIRNRGCEPPAPIPLMAFHGTADEIVAYDNPRGRFPPAEAWTADWADENGCDATPQTLPSNGDVSGVEYVNCDENASVILYTIAGGGHTWPGAVIRIAVEEWLGYTTQDIDATASMWQFFVDHPLQ